jgi:two-component system, NarL family, nitrate/nitrite response regulator NarL
MNDRDISGDLKSAAGGQQHTESAAVIDIKMKRRSADWAVIESLRSGTKISVIAVDDRPLVMNGIVSALKGEVDIELVAKVSDGQQSLAAIEKLRPNVVLLELHIAGVSAFEIIETLHKTELPTRPVIMAGAMTHDEFMRAMELHVKGVFFLGMPAWLLSRCVRVVHADGEFIESDMWRRSIGVLNERTANPPSVLPSVLTSRESAIAELAMTGLGNKQVARKLSITEGTVKSHLHRIYGKLRINGRYGLIKLASEKGAPRPI